MDLADYSEKRFREIEAEYREFLAQLGLEARVFIPASAKQGENIARKRSQQNEMVWRADCARCASMNWKRRKRRVDLPLRFCVQDVYRFDERRIIAGRIETGVLRVGDRLVFSPANKSSDRCDDRAMECGRRRRKRIAGDSIGITLREQIFVERGYVASHETDDADRNEPLSCRSFLDGERAVAARRAVHDSRSPRRNVKGRVVAIKQIMDSSTLNTTTDARREVARNEVGRVTIQTRAPIVLDNHDRIANLGRFVVIDDGRICGGGIVFGGAYTDRTAVKSKNIFWTEGKITARQRALTNGHRGAVVWLTGLSGAGKSTIAQALEGELFKRAMHTYVLDGDNIRHGLNSNLGFSPEDRVENIRRVSEVAKLMADAGTVVITAFISPYRRERRRAREIALEGNAEFVEVFVDAPLAVCEERDPKNLYKKARAGEIRDFTGIDAPYEPPEDAEIVVRTDRQKLDESVATILDQLLPRLRAEELLA